MAKSQFSGAKRMNLPKSKGTSWQSNNCCSKDHPFILPNFMGFGLCFPNNFTSVFFSCVISKALESLGRPWRFVLHHLILPPSHFVCPLFHFGMSQNIVLFLKIKVINLLMFLLYPYFKSHKFF